MKNQIVLRGVRVHNLKNIDLDVPLNKQIIVTGISGSGKSSLAFDTLYAEGQRRYIESLSAYARQFLERMDKPDADRIEGITPAVAIQQKAVTKNPRSTVATVTEIHDFLRVLYARIGTIHCLKCGKPVQRDTIDAVVDSLSRLPSGRRLWILFSPLEKQNPKDILKKGFPRIIQDNRIVDLEQAAPDSSRDWFVLIDRFVLDQEERERLVDSLELGFKEGGGRTQVWTDFGEKYLFSTLLECKDCGILYEEPVPNLFSFNSPQGACPACHGFGDLAVYDEDKVIPDPDLSLEDGAVEPWTKPTSRRRMRKLIDEAQKRGIPTDVPFKNLKEEWKEFVLHGEGKYKGVLGFFERLKKKNYKVQVRVFLSRYRKYIPCPECGQARLNKKALNIRIHGFNIGEVTGMTVKKAHDFFQKLPLKASYKQVAEKLIVEIQNRLNFLLEVGLDYITLDRITFTLSGGEAQRINLAAALSSALVGTLFVLDEPSIGLHARDNHRLVDILRSLKSIGNTVLVVEHDPDIIRSAEYIIDMGPGAGEKGGQILFSGTMNNFLKDSHSLTAQYMRGEKGIPMPDKRHRSAAFISVIDAHKNNLKHIDVRFPLNALTCVTGVSGSGKSSLLHDVLYLGWLGKAKNGFRVIEGKEQIDKLIMVDQSPLSPSPRSIPATYTKAMDEIRTIFSKTPKARAQGFGPGHFSFNTAGGRCEECKGAGSQVIEMQFLSDIVLVCEACKGKRFKKEILDIRYRGKNIDDILNMSVSKALAFFSDHSGIQRKLQPLTAVGLGYLRIGQPTNTLSGGESQRIKLAFHLIHQKQKKILYLFDEPSIGLHPDDVSVLLKAFWNLIREGHTVIIIEHNLDIIKCADHIIDLGPEGGDRGGKIVVQGTPEEVIRSARSHTARFLRPLLEDRG